MDVNNLQRNNENKNSKVPADFYNIVSKILTFVDETDKNAGINKTQIPKKKGD